ncbi:innexin inx2-like [Galendromus occidentalis]|uniref:Innexin n=1 Tax=Galendromus occidentalis TaxID=34638 RepID=A0AAJ7P9V8_9ACAR|nr:innexin inx2-like [Galendromus occidentalis]
MTKFNEIFSSVVKYFRPRSAHSDDFRLGAIHYKMLFGLLIASSLLTGLTAWYSQIECQEHNKASFDASLVKQWCYANSMFVVDYTNAGEPYGISNSHRAQTSKVVFLKYYQWVTLALFIQAVLFQIPRIVWKSIEGGRLRRMTDLVKNLEFVPAGDRTAKVALVVDYFMQAPRRHRDRNYFLYCALCQFSYLIITISQIYFTDAFLNRQFIFLMPRWFLGEPILQQVFPTQAKCLYRTYGAGGDLQKHDFLCVLAMNILISKLYLLLWLLLAIALIAAIFQTIYLIALCFSTRMQRNLSRDREFLDKLSCSAGDCLLLKFFRESIDCVVYAEFKKLASLRAEESGKPAEG